MTLRRIALLLVAAALLLLAARFLLISVVPFLLDVSPDQFGYFWQHRAALLAHLVGGSVALLTGPFQLWSGLAGLPVRPHRWSGRVYVLAVVVGGLAAFYLASQTTDVLRGFSLAALGFAWWVTTCVAVVAIRRGQRRRHKEWAIRSYTVTFSFVTFRLAAEAGVLASLGAASVVPLLWLSWTVPLLIVEATIRVLARDGVPPLRLRPTQRLP